MTTPSENLWYYSDGTSSFGPLTPTAIRQLIEAKVILPEFTVRRDGEETWTPLPEVDLDASPSLKSARPTQQPSVAPPPPPIASGTSYHLTRNGTNSGPYSVDELRGMIQRREVTSSDLIWKDGMDDWAKIGSISEFRIAGSPPPPPASPKNIPSFLQSKRVKLGIGAILLIGLLILLFRPGHQSNQSSSPTTGGIFGQQNSAESSGAMMQDAKNRLARQITGGRCATCQGTGQNPFYQPPCSSCGGHGTITTPSGYSAVCSSCGGTGKTRSNCSACGGTGRMP